MTVYLDIILIENICMNYVILYVTSIVYNKTKPKKIWLIESSLLGAVYAILNYIQIFNAFSNIPFKVLLSICMVYLAFKPKGFKALIKELIVFYMVSFVFGGATVFLLYFIKPQDILIKNGIYIGKYSTKIIILGAIVGTAILNLITKIIKGKLTKKELFCDIEIVMGDKQAKVKAIIDTGNFLIEPITGNKVIVVERSSLYDIFPAKILDNVDSILKGKWEEECNEYAQKIKIIPFSSLGRENGVLLGVKPDMVIVKAEDEQIQIQNVVIGIYNNSLTKNGLYSALIGTNAFERSDDNEFAVYAKKQH